MDFLVSLLVLVIFLIGYYAGRTSMPKKIQVKSCSCATVDTDAKHSCHCTCGRSKDSKHTIHHGMHWH